MTEHMLKLCDKKNQFIVIRLKYFVNNFPDISAPTVGDSQVPSVQVAINVGAMLVGKSNIVEQGSLCASHPLV